MIESIVNKFKGKTCIVTGASSGIGKAIVDMLLDNEIVVYGFGRSNISDDRYNYISCDLLDIDSTLKYIDQIVSNNDVRILINAAGTAYYGLHEDISPDKIMNMVRTDLEVPMILTGHLMRNFKSKGNCHIINISSVTASKPAPHGACYGACKAGLSSFSSSIWEEARKHGVYITDVCPDMTESNLYRNADFETDNDIEAKLLPEDVAQAIESILAMREGTCVTLIKVTPRFNRIKRKANNKP